MLKFQVLSDAEDALVPGNIYLNTCLCTRPYPKNKPYINKLFTLHSGGTNGKETIGKCRRYKGHGFDPWVRDPLEEGIETHPSILFFFSLFFFWV